MGAALHNNTFEGVVLVLFLVSLHCCSPSEARGKPTIYPAQDFHILAPGDTWSLLCKSRPGGRRLTWDTKGAHSKLDQRLHLKYSFNEDSLFHESSLTLEAVEYLDSGLYTCSSSSSNRGESSSVYLWVDDKKHLIDFDEELHYVNIYRSQRVVLPCRPTHPDVKFRFFKNGFEITDKLESQHFSYNSQEGLIIGNGSLNFHNGQINCQASRNGVVENLIIILFFKELPEVLPPPNIQLRTPRPIQGESVNVDCRVLFQDYYSNLHLKWLLPDEFEGNERFIIGKQRKKSFTEPGLEEHFVLFRTLTILNVTKSDSGMYKCQLTAAEGALNVSSPKTQFNLTIYQAEERYISEPAFSGDPKVVIDDENFQEDEIRWIFSIDAYPNPQYLLITPNGDEVLFGSNDDKYQFVSDKEQTRKKVAIANPTLNDTGIYHFIIRLNDSNKPVLEKSIQLTFLYLKHPELTIKSTKKPEDSFYMDGHFYNLTCEVFGYPLDFKTFVWTFQPTDGGPKVEINEFSFEESHHHYQYNLKAKMKDVVARKDGTYRCSICTLPSNYNNHSKKSTCSSQSMDFVIADSVEGHSIISKNTPSNENEVQLKDELIEGDQLNYFLTCLVSNKKYNRVDWWLQKNVSEPWILLNTSKTSHQAMSINASLLFNESHPADSGTYDCRVTETNSSLVSIRQAVIDILPMVAPIKVANNSMDGAQIKLEASDTLSLNCEVLGRPLPSVEWAKDGSPFLVDKDKTVTYGGNKFILYFKYATPKHSGKYSCHVKNRAGELAAYKNIFVEETRWISTTTTPIIFVVLIIIVIVLMTCSIVIGILLKKYADKNKKLSAQQVTEFIQGNPESVNPELDIQEQAHLLPYNKDEFEFPREKLRIGRLLGSGEFGYVKLATATGLIPGENESLVAVKSVKPNADYSYFQILLSELKIMIHLGKHENIVNLLGAVTTGLARKEVYIIVEYCEYGNLSKYLSKSRHNFMNQINTFTGKYCPELCTDVMNGEYFELHPSNNPPVEDPLIGPSRRSMVCIGDTLKTQDLIDWAMQICNGMEYLSEKHVVHRDLACRNILLAENNIIKICDFGLSRNMYKVYSIANKKSSPVPVKWLSLESLKFGAFTTRSDIWSFGIVLWEMFSLGSLPYPGLEYGNLLPYLESGKRMKNPKYCPNSIYYRLMLQCWSEDPARRPSFSSMKYIFEKMLLSGNDIDDLHYSYDENRHPSLEELLSETRLNGILVDNPTYLQDPQSPLVSCEKSHPLEDCNGYLVPNASS